MATKKKSASKSKKAPAVEVSQDAATQIEANAEQAPVTSTIAGPTLQDVAEGYLAWLDKDGAGDGTLSSYKMELKTAMAALGAATPLAELTVERVAEYFASDVVMKTRHGKHKAKATIDKTRRVLRLALVWAQDEKLVEVAPIPEGSTKRATLKAV